MAGASSTKRKATDTLPKAAKKAKMIPTRYFEQKSFNFGAAIGATSTGFVTHITDIDSGTGRDNRQGNRLTVNSIDFRGYLAASTAGTAQQSVRIMIIQDKQQGNASFPTISDIFESNNISGLDLSQRDRYKVFYDKLYCLNKIDNTSPVFKTEGLKMNVVPQYGSNLGTTISKNGLYLIVFGDAASNNPSVTYNLRVNYTDW